MVNPLGGPGRGSSLGSETHPAFIYLFMVNIQQGTEKMKHNIFLPTLKQKLINIEESYGGPNDFYTRILEYKSLNHPIITHVGKFFIKKMQGVNTKKKKRPPCGEKQN